MKVMSLGNEQPGYGARRAGRVAQERGSGGLEGGIGAEETQNEWPVEVGEQRLKGKAPKAEIRLEAEYRSKQA